VNNTLIKGLRLMEELARSGAPLGLSELARASCMSRSGARCLLQSLVQEKYVTQLHNRDYAVSIKLWELGTAALPGFDLRRVASLVMETLMKNTGERVHLAVLDGQEVIYVHKVDSEAAVRCHTPIGGRAAASCVATGKAMMAFKSDAWLAEAIGSLPAPTRDSISVPATFLKEMKKVRAQRFAVNRGEWRKSVNGLAAPVFDAAGVVIAAIGISGPADGLTEKKLAQLAPDVREAARALSEELGKTAPHSSLLSVTNHWASIV
jgi:DNA-binding IclR family transcriptional regulator